MVSSVLCKLWQGVTAILRDNFKFNIDELYLKEYPLNYSSESFSSVLSRKNSEGAKILALFNHD